ncbi:MAG: ECF-type sigma factor [Lysobacteraceae bacterium]
MDYIDFIGVAYVERKSLIVLDTMLSDPHTKPASQVSESITALIDRASHGQPLVWNEIYSLLYRDLYRLARAQLWHSSGHTLTPTSLINETWLRLVRKDNIRAVNRKQLVCLVVSAMRMAILDEIRHRRAEKRGGGVASISLENIAVASERSDPDETLALDAALDELHKHAPRLAQVVEWRYFGGMSESEISSVLDVHVRTIRRDWQAAKLFLLQHMDNERATASIDER